MEAADLARSAQDLANIGGSTMAIRRRHQHDRATFEELDKMGQVRSMNATAQTLVRMTIAHGRRVGLDHARAAMIQRLEKAIEQVRLL